MQTAFPFLYFHYTTLPRHVKPRKLTGFAPVWYWMQENAVLHDSGQTLFFPTVCGRKEVLRMRKKAFELFICAVIVLYIFLVNAR